MTFNLSIEQNQLKKMIAASAQNFPSSYAFNFLPSRYIHDGWMAQIFGPNYDPGLRDKIQNSSFADARLNALILKKFGLNGQYCYEFHDFAQRFALMPNQELEKIIKIIGMIPYLSDLKKIIDKQQVTKIRNYFGITEYRFLVKRLPFLLSEKMMSKMMKLKVPPFDIEKLETQIFNNGIQCLLIWLQDQPLSISQRIRLKFNTQTHWELQDAFKTFALNDIQIIFKKIIREVVPTWRHLFV